MQQFQLVAYSVASVASLLLLGILCSLLAYKSRQLIQRRGYLSAVVFTLSLIGYTWTWLATALARLPGMLIFGFIPLFFRAWTANYGKQLMIEMLTSLTMLVLIGTCDVVSLLIPSSDGYLISVRSLFIVGLCIYSVGKFVLKEMKKDFFGDKVVGSNSSPKLVMERELGKEETLKAFKAFLSKEMAEESINFFVLVRSFMNDAENALIQFELGQVSQTATEDAIRIFVRRAKRIYQQFVATGSKTEVNISFKTRDKIVRQVGKFQKERLFEYSIHQILVNLLELYKEAYEEVLILLFQDPWRRFMNSSFNAENAVASAKESSVLSRIVVDARRKSVVESSVVSAHYRYDSNIGSSDIQGASDTVKSIEPGVLAVEPAESSKTKDFVLAF